MGSKAISITRKNRSVQRERARRQNAQPPDIAISAHLEAILRPATYTQLRLFAQLGLRARSLGLPMMVAFVVSLIWRQLGSVSEAVRVLDREGLLWTKALKVSQQSVSKRLTTLPAVLFENILQEILPQMRQRARDRTTFVSAHIQWARDHFSDMLIADASTLDALVKKTRLMLDAGTMQLGGKIIALLEVGSHLPRQIFFEADAASNEQRYWESIIDQLVKNSLLLIDMGFTNYARFNQLTAKSVWFITRAKKTMAYRIIQVLSDKRGVRDLLIDVGSTKAPCTYPMRLVEVTVNGTLHSYLTNLTDTKQLPAAYVGALYRERWRIEEAFLVAKRLLGLAYFHTTSLNAVQLQIHATWILYAVLVDLREQLAAELKCPPGELSLEMTFRALYHFTQARDRGETDNLIAYLIAPENLDSLGIRKRKRNKNPKPRKLLVFEDSP